MSYIKKIKTKVNKAKYKVYAPVVLSILNKNFNYDDVKEFLNLPYANVSSFIASLTKINFESLSQKDQLAFYIGFSKFEKQLKQDLLKKMMYPIFLCILSFVMTLYFSNSFAPSIIDLLHGFEVNTQILSFLHLLINIVKCLMLIVLLFIALLLLVLLQKDFSYVLYIRFHHYRFMSLIKNLMTLRFSFVYLFLLQRELNTQRILNEIKNSIGIADVKWLAFHIEKEMLKGQSLLDAFNQAYFEPLFLVHIQQGYFTKNLTESIKSYIELMTQIIQAQAQSMILLFKTLTYIYILILVSIYYYFLFQPLSIMEAIL